jgi:hypothetical protein
MISFGRLSSLHTYVYGQQKTLSVLTLIIKVKQNNPSVEVDSTQLMKNFPVRYGTQTPIITA